MSLRTCLRYTSALIASGLAASSAYAYDFGEYGKITGDFRYRYEYIDQQSALNDAHANTARLRLGYLTPTYEGFSGFVEGEAIYNVFDDHFNDGSNGKTSYPSVNDPDDLAVNQMYLKYAMPDTGHSAILGRQYLTFDTQRFIGWSKFRQNDTTHDAARITLAPVEGMTVDYAHSVEVHRSLGSRQPLGTYEGSLNMLHADYKLPAGLKVAGYGYILDFDNASIAGLSSETYGGRLEWRPKDKDASWMGIVPIATIDIANQSDTGDNPDDYNEWYNWFELGGAYDGYTLTAVYERLGGNGTAAMQTPIGTVHSYNGWVDKFTTVPDNGLEDYFLWFKAPIGLPWKDQKLNFEAQLHHFDSDVNDVDYGDEIDLGLAYTPVEGHTVTAQVGRYYANDISSDTTKVWVYYDMKF